MSLFNYLRCFIFIQFFILNGIFSTLVDLEDQQQDFVLQVKKIEIPNCPDAFNPSIIRWRGSLLLSFRFRDDKGSTNPVGLTWLNENFDPIGNPQLLRFKHQAPAGSSVQDPRLILVQDHLYLVYSNTWETREKNLRRVFIAEVHYDGIRFSTSPPEVFLNFDSEDKTRVEKNWVPFEYNKDLLLSYSIMPHKIFLPLLKTKKCSTIALSDSSIRWDWGELRGGTPALLVGNEYLSFFHSSKVMKTVQSKGQSMPHYFIGAYTFESKPPFKITKISPTFIREKSFYTGVNYKTWKPLKVVFPGGFIFNEKYIWISYGRQDHEMWVVKLDKNQLLKSLIKVK